MQPKGTSAPFYFGPFEERRPPQPIPYSVPRELLWQFLATMNLTLGAWYIVWRWGWSLNPEAWWFAVPLVVAETCAYLGLVLFTINLWMVRDTPPQPPPYLINDCIRHPDEIPSRPLRVDIFFATYNEDPELVRLGVQDAKKITYPHPIDVQIHVLDDGHRSAMQQVASEEGVHYITRATNTGFKAGNLRHAMEQTYGDFMVICDADTRPFPTLLAHTLGYFRDPHVAWVQTPQWFFDLPAGKPLPVVLERYLQRPGRWLGRLIEAGVGPVQPGRDPFRNDSMMFFDVILRRRNWANASFCCGAGSIHRREAVLETALKTYADAVDGLIRSVTRDVIDAEIKADLSEAMRRELALETELTPYKFHVSEDIYTSIVVHADAARRWKSVYHPSCESKMLSPQDLLSWVIQRFKYAGGTLDIFLHDNPLFRPGLTLPQKLMYGATFWSYFGGVWNTVFFLAPIIYLFTGIAPVAAYSQDFFKHALPFLFANTLACMVGTWGVDDWGGKTAYLAFFPVNLRALWTVLKGEKITFSVTPKHRQEGNFFRLVIPQFLVIALTIAGLLFAGVSYALGSSMTLQSLMVNVFWGLHNVLALQWIIAAGMVAARRVKRRRQGHISAREEAPMTFKEGLLKARSHLIFLLGLSVACGLIITLETWDIQRPSGAALQLPRTASLATVSPTALTAQEQQWTRIAWRYFDNNYQPTTGLVNSVHGYPSSTMWDTASYLLALIAAQRLDLIEQAVFDQRLSQALTTLASIPLFDDSLPNKAYHTISLKMVDYTNATTTRGIGWSAIDIGRLLVPLNILVWHYPTHTPEVQAILQRWAFHRLLRDGRLYGATLDAQGNTVYVQEGRIGYEAYAAKALALMGLDVSRALQYHEFLRLVTLYGIDVPTDNRSVAQYHAHNYVVSEPYILDGLEFGWDATSQEFAFRVYRVQEERFARTGVLTAVSEDNIDQAPYFVYNTVFTNGQPWKAITDQGADASAYKSISTKAVFGWDVLYKTPYTTRLLQRIANLYDPERGWYSGLYETTQTPNTAITANTNAIILESLCYRRFGRLIHPVNTERVR